MGELTNSLRKTYTSLSTHKSRREHNLFMAQGTKCVLDTIDSFDIETIIATRQWIDHHKTIEDCHDVTIVYPSDLKRISTLSSPPDVVAIYRIPDIACPVLKKGLSIALDGVQDPGNLGTIIRVADWMGVSYIIASPDTVDVWNPKVVQATMGAISRVKVYYSPLSEILREIDVPIYGTFLDGEDIYKSELTPDGMIVMGNEGNGISREVSGMVDHRLLIPSYPPERTSSESLNVAVATAITLSEFRRRMR